MKALVILQTQSFDIMMDRVRLLLENAGTSALELLLAVGIVLIGWVLGRILAQLVLWLLRAVRFNDGIRGVIGGGPPWRHEPADMASRAVFWIVVMLAAVFSADALGFDLSTLVGDRLRDVLPRVIAATIMLSVGVALAMVMGGVVRRLFEGAGARGARLRGQITTAILTAFAVLIALEQLGLAAQFIMALGLTAVGAAALAAGLAFGLGCRELARDFVVEYLRSMDQSEPQRPL